MPSEPLRKHWIDGALPSFVVQLFLSTSAPWVWLLPAMILAFNVATWKSHIARSNFSDAWANYFTSDCGASECLYEILITAPFYTSVAYTVGWIAKAVARPRGGNR